VCRTAVGRACGDKDDGRIGGTHRSFNTFCHASEASFNVWMRAAIWARRRKWSGTCSQCNVPQCLSIARNRRRKLLRCVPRRCYFYFLVLSNMVSMPLTKVGSNGLPHIAGWVTPRDPKSLLSEGRGHGMALPLIILCLALRFFYYVPYYSAALVSRSGHYKICSDT
jgi:hypothetical protein